MKGQNLLNLLIVEDEARIARRIERLLEEILENHNCSLTICHKFHQAQDHIRSKPVDLLFLDLNLLGKNGFQLLQAAVAESFATIVISAYRDKAIEAFEYGVLDFILKPFKKDRLEKAIHRFLDRNSRAEHPLKYLPIKKHGSIQLLKVEEITFIKGANIYAEIHLKNGGKELSDKNLESILQLLPAHFARIHKSYIANMKEAVHISVHPGGKYELGFEAGLVLPIGRTKYKLIRDTFFPKTT